MTSVDTEYYGITRILLLAVGLWPFQQSKFVLFQRIIFLNILTSFVVFQLTTFVTAEIFLKVIINVLSSVLCFMIFTGFYITFSINGKSMRYLLTKLQQICNNLKDKNEVAIIRKYRDEARRIINGFVLIFACADLLFCCEPILPRISGFFMLLNDTRLRRAPYIMTEYFIDQEKYFYLFILHMDAAISIGLITMLAIGSQSILYVQYIYGMFKIASYRIERSMTKNMLQNINIGSNAVICKKIAYAVDIHRKAMESATFFASTCDVCLCVIATLTVTCLSLNLYGIASSNRDVSQLFIFILRVILLLGCMFLGNYLGQKLIDHNYDVIFSAYNVPWYEAPVYVQKLILMILQRGNKSFNVVIGRLIVACLENFASMTSVSISYFTVIYSLQQ